MISSFVNKIRLRWHGNLNYRIAYSLILVTVLVALVFGTITVATIFHFVRAKEAASLNNLIDSASSRIESFLNDITSNVANLARNTIVMNALVDTYGRDSYLIPFLKGYPITEAVPHRVSLCDFQGTVIASSTDKSGAYRDQDLLEELIEKNRASSKIVDRGKRSGNHLLICYPVTYRATGTSEGFLVFEAALQDILKIAAASDAISFSLFQKDSLVSGRIGKEHEVALRRKLDLEHALQRLDLTLEGRTLAGHAVRWVGGGLILATVLMIWLAIRISYRVSNHLTRRIVLLSETAGRIAKSGTPDSRVPVSGNDEITHLAEAFNRMVERLRISYEALEGRVEERTLLLAETNRNLTAEIKQRYDAEVRLRESERKYRELIENANSVILTWDVNGAVTFFNKYAEQFFGFSQEEILGRNVVGTIVPALESSGRDLAALMKEICEDPERFKDNENENITKDGRRVWVRWMNKAVFDAAGRPIGILSIGNDVTERKRAEASLRESEQRFRGAFENAAVGASMVDLKGRFIKVNRFLCEMLGYTEAEMLSKTFSDVTHPDDIHIGLEYLKRQVSGGLDSASFEKRYIRKDGSIVHIIVSPAIIRDGAGAPQYFMGLFQNITERRKLLEQLEQLNRNLAERVREEIAKNRTKEQLLQLQSRHAAMGEMIDNIAHQWRQPLNNLGLVLQGMQKKFDDGGLTRERMHEQAKTGMSLIRYMSQTISDFTNFFRHDKEIMKFKVKDVVSTALGFMETTLKRNAITVVIDIDDDITVKGYRNEYTQVLVNILNNARDVFVERTIQSPVITLCAFRENGLSVLTIADNGGGVRDEVMGRMFTPYFTTKEHNKGTGIGLYMSKTIIENNMNGKLTVCNNHDGAEFRIEVRDGK